MWRTNVTSFMITPSGSFTKKDTRKQCQTRSKLMLALAKKITPDIFRNTNAKMSPYKAAFRRYPTDTELNAAETELPQ